MEKLVSLSKRRGFIYPGSAIYGGLANSWDYGPLGVELKQNIKRRWWDRFVRGREDIIGLDSAIIMNTHVWEASGHLAEFSDPLVEDKVTHERYRLDHLLEEKGVRTAGLSFSDLVKKAEEKKLTSPNGHELTEPRQFNLMLKTYLGAIAEKGAEVYLRPETAQGMFVDFKSVLDTTRKNLPFGIAQIGKAFRNEITPGNFIFRTREFEQMEIEYFIAPPESDSDWEKYLEAWREEMRQWINDLGIESDQIEEVDVPEGERAHYSRKTIDFEFEFPFGRKELYGLAYRTDFDLKNHSESSGVDLVYTNNAGNKIRPHVIEPTWGVDRTVLAALTSAYREEDLGEGDIRTVLKFPHWLAPIKVAILPLSKKEELSEVARGIYKDLLKAGLVAEYDETQSIGKRYRRQDEIGTPFCVTVDFDSLEDKKITVRERDSMQQDRINITDLKDYLKDKLS